MRLFKPSKARDRHNNPVDWKGLGGSKRENKPKWRGKLHRLTEDGGTGSPRIITREKISAVTHRSRKGRKNGGPTKELRWDSQCQDDHSKPNVGAKEKNEKSRWKDDRSRQVRPRSNEYRNWRLFEKTSIGKEG